MVKATKAWRAFCEWLPSYGSQSSLARALGITQSSVSRWERRESRPEPHHRDAIELLSGGAVKASEWLTKAEQAAVARIRAEACRTGTSG